MYIIHIYMYICDLIIQSTSNQSNSRWRAWSISVAIRFCYEVQEVVPKTYLGLFEHIMSITNSNGLLLSPVKWSWSEGITWYNGVYPTFSQRLRLDHSSTGVFLRWPCRGVSCCWKSSHFRRIMDNAALLKIYEWRFMVHQWWLTSPYILQYVVFFVRTVLQFKDFIF